MYVCVCKAVTDKQIRHAVKEGLCTRKELFQCFGVGGDCGKCNQQVKKILSENTPFSSIMQPTPEPIFNNI
ncbi:MAG: (2Fe-2S)-binding protein [Gammaproteobacteria bacterium]